MKKYILTALISFAIIEVVYSQTDKQQIASIEKETKEIQNKVGKYRKTEIFKDSIGNKYAYKDGNEIKLLTIYYQDTDANKNVEWYFFEEKLIYIQQIWTDKETNKIVDSKKCYLNSGQLIAWVINDKLVDANSEEFKKVKIELGAYGKKLIEQTN